MLREKLINKKSGLLLYGITPPKENNTQEKLISITQRRIERIQSVNSDGIVLYDIQDESERTGENRTFPFLPTIDPFMYCENYLNTLNIEKIVYKSVCKYDKPEFESWLKSLKNTPYLSVFVGAPTKGKQCKLKLDEAYELRRNVNNDILLGGVCLPERHTKHNNEHTRIVEKSKHGCTFFISQCICNVEALKNYLSDYYYYCIDNNIEVMYQIFTLTIAGTMQTLTFMKWLGISIPKWLENELAHSQNIIDKSIELNIKIASELIDFCKEKNIPFGFNVESVSIRKDEIEASLILFKGIEQLLIQNGYRD